LPMATVQHRWLGQVVETDDGLPFIGEHAHREFIATGFCGNGFTLGTLSAMMARDRYLGRKNPWFDLSYLGLSLPRLALPRHWRRAERASGGTPGASRSCCPSGMTGYTASCIPMCKGSCMPLTRGCAEGVCTYCILSST
jgi:glycine/D-amino acid oxidase-like deaminating enzyme